MTLDERLEALVMSTELLTRDVETLRDTVKTDSGRIDKLLAAVEVDAGNIRALARIAEIHEHRLTGLEDGTT